MNHLIARFTLGLALIFASLVFSLPAAKHGQVAAKQFSAAYTVLSQSGTIGYWALFEPPGYLPVKCVYPSGTMALQYIEFPYPLVYPVDLSQTEEVAIEGRLYRRLSNGTLTAPTVLFTSTGMADFDDPFGAASETFGSAINDLGSTYVAGVEIRWLTGAVVRGRVELLYTQYQTRIDKPPFDDVIHSPGPEDQLLPRTDACKPALPAVATLGNSQGTVNQTILVTINRFPQNSPVTVYFDGTAIGSVATNIYGNGPGNFVVPAKPMGTYPVKFYRFGRTASVNFTIKPRIKLIPSSGLERGDSVNVSLRGFAANETVRIRWKNSSGSWIQVAQVVTSSTGSKNVDITVPNFAVIGANSVRGDGNKGAAAQTNAVAVVASASSVSAAQPSPTPTAIPATATLIPTATSTQTVQPPTVTATATVEPTNTQIAEPTAATLTPAPTESATSIPTAEPTVVPEG